MNIKKSLSVVLVFALLISVFLTIPASAIGVVSEDKVEPVQSADRLFKTFSEGYGVMFDCIVKDHDGIRPEDYQIMSPITFNGSTSIYHFPIADNQGIIHWILSVGLNDDGSFGATIGQDFAPLLNEVLSDGFNQVYLIQDDRTLYAIVDNNIYKQVGSEVIQVNKTEMRQSSLSSVTGISPNDLSFNEQYSAKAIESYRAFVAVEAEQNSISATTSQSVAELTNYPHIYNGFNSLCWAATVATMVRYEKPSVFPNLTATNVANQLGIPHDNGGTPEDVVSALNYYLGSPYLPTHLSRILTYSEIMTVVNNNDPAYLRMLSEDLTIGHGIALIGYNIGSSYARIKIMDPAYQNQTKYCLESSSGEWQVFYANTELYWRETVRLYYS